MEFQHQAQVVRHFYGAFMTMLIHDLLNSDLSECDEEWLCLFTGIKMRFGVLSTQNIDHIRVCYRRKRARPRLFFFFFLITAKKS